MTQQVSVVDENRFDPTSSPYRLFSMQYLSIENFKNKIIKNAKTPKPELQCGVLFCK